MGQNTYLKLSNNVNIPVKGFGTWQIPNGKPAYDAVSLALKCGYRHIDTAHAYGNEESVGQAIRESGIDRGNVFVTSKLPAWIKTYSETHESYNKTLSNLGLDYLDLYLIHSPHPWDKRWEDFSRLNIEVWKAMQEIYKSGRCRAIGVSNFKVADLVPILENCEIKPMVNQIEYFIGNTHQKIVAFCQSEQILVEGYSPLATGAILKNPQIISLAQKYQVSTARICLRYVIQKGVVPITKSTNPSRILENFDCNFEISPEDMLYLDGLKNTLNKKFWVILLKKIYHAVCTKLYYKKH
jgi:diketogulonate reductase-like aldo/keto reductase